MTTIRQEDFIASIADAFQYISYYHPLDYIQALGSAYEREQNPAAKDAIAQILTNSRMSAEGRRPICQDTGIATVFLKVGMNLRWDATLSVDEMVNEGVRFVVGHLCSSSTQPASDIYEDEGILMVTPASTSPDITERGYELVFRTIGLDSMQGPVAANYLISQKPERVAGVMGFRRPVDLFQIVAEPGAA